MHCHMIGYKGFGSSDEWKDTEVRAPQTMATQGWWNLEEDGLENQKGRNSQSRKEEWLEQGPGAGSSSQVGEGTGSQYLKCYPCETLQTPVSQGNGSGLTCFI